MARPFHYEHNQWRYRHKLPMHPTSLPTHEKDFWHGQGDEGHPIE